MYCSSCGAPLRGDEEKCPYCGSYIPPNAERAYMEHLEDIRDDTEGLKDIAQNAYKKELKQHGRIILKAALIIALIAFFLTVISTVFLHVAKHKENSRIRAEIKFREEFFPKLNELHETGDYDLVCDFMNSLDVLDGSSALWSWEHMAFYDYYIYYQELCSFEQSYKENDVDEFLLSNAFFDAIYLYHTNRRNSYELDLTEEDYLLVTSYREEAIVILEQVFHLSGEELEKVYQSCLQYDYPSYDLCNAYLETMIEDCYPTDSDP